MPNSKTKGAQSEVLELQRNSFEIGDIEKESLVEVYEPNLYFECTSYDPEMKRHIKKTKMAFFGKFPLNFFN